jgi:hypothetical protein
MRWPLRFEREPMDRDGRGDRANAVCHRREGGDPASAPTALSADAGFPLAAMTVFGSTMIFQAAVRRGATAVATIPFC